MSRKRRSLRLDEKLKILKFVDENPTSKRRMLARQLDIPVSTLATVVGKRERIEANVQRFGPACRSTKAGQHKNLDDFMLSWMSDVAEAPSVEEMRETAQAVARSMGIDGFTASNGWLWRFKKRHGFARCSRPSSAKQRAAVSSEGTRREPEDLLAFLGAREQYHPRDVYVIGWTQLYYALLPSDLVKPDPDGDLLVANRATAVRQRVGVILGVNEDCTDRLAPWVVGRRSNPKNLRNVCNPPCTYLASEEDLSRAPVDALEQYLDVLESRMRTEKRVVAVFLTPDLAEAVSRDFKNVRLYSLGGSGMSSQNPLDVGILTHFQRLYRTFLFRRFTVLNNQPEEARPTLLVAMSFIATSWDSLEQDVVRTAFKACGFRGCILSHSAAVELEQDDVAGNAVDTGDVLLDNFVQMDEELTLDEVTVKQEPDVDESFPSEEPQAGDEGQTQQVVTNRDALKALDTLRLYLCHNDCGEEALKAFRALERELYKSFSK
uniref:Centromere protein B n=1 Tax=Rhipicephalus appendiculatus TaxID=34631 RepID=A0A131YYX4_RHIAP